MTPMCWKPESLHRTCLRASTVWKGPVRRARTFARLTGQVTSGTPEDEPLNRLQLASSEICSMQPSFGFTMDSDLCCAAPACHNRCNEVW